MERSSIIATVVAAGGILIAGSVASVAVINAASSNQPDSETIQLVAAGSTDSPTPEATVSAGAEQATAAAAELPTMEASKLPELPEVAPPAGQPAAVQAAPATTAKSASKDSDDDSTSSEAARPAYTVSESQARSDVLRKGDGVSIVSSSKESHQGYSTWAVRITRANGEVLTGYVDRVSGVVVDWTVNQKAQAPQPTSSSDDDDSDEYDDESEDESDDEYEYEDESDEGESDDDD